MFSEVPRGIWHVIRYGIPLLWQSVADKSISNQKGVSKQMVGLYLEIFGGQMTATKKRTYQMFPNMVMRVK